MLFDPRLILRLLILLLVAAAAGGTAMAQKQADDSALLAGVKEAIKKAEAEGGAGKDAGSGLPYSETSMAAILCAAEDFISQPAARTLKARLQFKPRYRDAADYTRTIRRPASSDSRHHRLGTETVTVEVKQNDDNKVIEGYEISGGDAESLRQIGSACFFLQQTFKDTPLDSSSVRFRCPALKNLHTLITHLPRYAGRYLEVEGITPRMYDVRMKEVEAKRKELLQVQGEWLGEMAPWRKLLKENRNKKPQDQN